MVMKNSKILINPLKPYISFPFSKKAKEEKENLAVLRYELHKEEYRWIPIVIEIPSINYKQFLLSPTYFPQIFLPILSKKEDEKIFQRKATIEEVREICNSYEKTLAKNPIHTRRDIEKFHRILHYYTEYARVCELCHRERLKDEIANDIIKENPHFTTKEEIIKSAVELDWERMEANKGAWFREFMPNYKYRIDNEDEAKQYRFYNDPWGAFIDTRY